jgi:hypothetical protein
MTAPADLVVTQLSVEAGEAQESADFITVWRPGSLWPLRRRTDQFCALLAPDRPNQGPLCRQVLDVMEREFAASGNRSATSTLSAVLLAAHQFLRRENSLAMPGERVRLQAAAVVLRAGAAYIGRVGPTFVVVRHRGRLQRFVGLPSADGTDELVGEPRLLGGEHDPHIAYGFSPFVPNDLLVLASGPQWERMRPDYIEAALDEGEPSAVASALYELGVWRQTRPTFSILVVEARAPERRGWLARAAPVEDELAEDDYADQAYASDVHEVAASRTYRYGAAGPRRAQAEAVSGAEEDWPGGRRAARHAPTYAERSRRRALQGGAPRGAAAVAQLTQTTLAALSPRALLVALMAVALVVLVVLGFTLVQILRPPPDQAAALTAGAQSLYEQARRAPDAPGTRDQLEEARQLLTRALALRDEPARRALLTDVQHELDRIDRVVRLPETPPLLDLAALGPEASVARVLVDGTDLYILDVGGARLLRYQFQADGTLQSPEPTVLVKRGDQVAGRAVGSLIAMTWVPAGGPRTDPGLVVVESGRTFLTYNPRAGLGRIVPADNVRWSAIAAMAGYQGNVYLVDPERQAVMEYRPTRNGYDSPPFAALDSRAGLAWDRVVDLAVDSNSLYILQGDGVLRKFSRERGEPQPFPAQAPDGLRGPIALTLPPGNDPRPLYVADLGGERVLQFTPDGVYQRQFRPPLGSEAFQGLRDVFLDANQRLYVLTTKALYRYELPPE